MDVLVPHRIQINSPEAAMTAVMLIADHLPHSNVRLDSANHERREYVIRLEASPHEKLDFLRPYILPPRD